MSRRRQQNIKNFTSDQLIAHGKWLMYNRWRLLAPHPFEPDAVYNALLTDEQHKAFEMIERTMPTSANHGNEVNLILDREIAITTKNGQRHKGTFLELNLVAARIVPDTSTYRNTPPHKFYLSSLPREMQEGIQEWAHKWLLHQSESAEVLAKFDALFLACNTIGQAVRVWPQVKSLLTERAQNKLAEAKVRSPYPEAVIERSNDWDDNKGNYPIIGVKDEWTEKGLQWYDERLTEALCLPEVYTKEDAHFGRWPLKAEFGPG